VYLNITKYKKVAFNEIIKYCENICWFRLQSFYMKIFEAVIVSVEA
jgi:hypothetical protein